jgi:mannose-6-phosphate isomerase-like protein (cupin superfamily)
VAADRCRGGRTGKERLPSVHKCIHVLGSFRDRSLSPDQPTMKSMKHSTVILSDNKNPSTVFGVHGGTGTLLWKRLATGSHLQADWDGFEWLALGPGDRMGKHTHTHTEEIFCFLSGTGLVTMDRDERRRSG